MPGMIPHQGSHAVARPKPCIDQRPSKLARPPEKFRVGVTVNLALRIARNNLGFAEKRPRAIQNRVQRKRKIHHAAAHGKPPGRSVRGVYHDK